MTPNTIHQLFQDELAVTIHSVEEISGLGVVNQLYRVSGETGDYVLRCNDYDEKQLEYQKEYWCLTNAREIGIPTPRVLKMGRFGDLVYMIQEYVPGHNGKQAPPEAQRLIWTALGRYARTYQNVKEIAVAEVKEREFHEDWKARLQYNLEQLHEGDRLLQSKQFSAKDHGRMRSYLNSLLKKKFPTGLVHGDLCPRNVIYTEGKTHLLDWGTAEINVVPHVEIGLVLLSREAKEEEFQLFLEGLGVSAAAFAGMQEDVYLLNLLHTLDKYRWAETFDLENIARYEKAIRLAFTTVSAHSG